jgi:hypothetical protein
MEFDEINALINIEREKFQRDLRHITTENTPTAPKTNIIGTMAEHAERAALMNAMRCAHDVQIAMERLNTAMKEHALHMKKLASL